MFPDLSLLPHAAQAHPFLLMVCVDGSSKSFLRGVLLWDTFAANDMESFSKRKVTHPAVKWASNIMLRDS